MGDEIISHYRIHEKIGSGGMGVVYKAEDTKLGRMVALKFLSEELSKEPHMLERFRREARAASALNHPNICTIYEIDEWEGKAFIAMELLEGQTLRNRIAGMPLGIDLVVELGVQIADGLEAAHSKGITHRDIKPANIFVTGHDQAKIVDFGLAKVTSELRPAHAMPLSELDTVSREEQMTLTGAVLGTVAYMSPEQARGEQLDRRTDLFSLGAVLYEMISGKPAFAGSTLAVIYDAILNRMPSSITGWRPGASAKLEEIIVKCLEKDRKLRYQSAADLRTDLARLQRETLTAVAGLSHPVVQRGDPVDSVAVLPFANASDDPNVEYLSDGITETLINSLSQLPNLRVKSRQSVFRYKGRQTDAQTVGRELAVRAVLNGLVKQRGDSISVSAELIDARNDDHIWGQQYHRKLTDIMRIQEEIAIAISENLRVKLSEKDHAQLTKRYTEKTEAYQNYLKGRYWWNKRTPEGIRRGIDYFKQAIEADPSYALPYGGLADSYALLAGVHPPKEVFPSARAAALKALEIDDRLAEAHTSLAYIYTHYDWKWSDAEKEYRRAIELNPNYPAAHSSYAKYLTAMARFDEATTQINLAQELDPLSPGIASGVAACFYAKRQYDRAIQRYREVLAMEPRFAAAHFSLGDVYLAKSMFDNAIEEYEAGLQISPNDATAMAELGYVYALAGRRADAVASLEKAMHSSEQIYVLPSSIALIHAGLRDKDAAFHWLEKGRQDRSWPMVYLNVEPRFDSLRSDPRFQTLLTQIGLPL